ncbi:MAG: FtsW/RodA/SpoVE family cell cycle protein [Phaeodactylibacter xiamenensis]|uniref:Probable peptidoglycan glycosyltransferase FtsW n=1 Tax=Phaeodactylibacter xiamenensis TaxID=1524460 RepID=A0A098S4B6_9BACT|nr:FtsW/RodA/SpoVE family cell cycle protein [Phaeodactylibacter xiamenensis]KGE86821.1 cell division protein FtsW [Phaeodactylibacter xiamenensis]MCR9052115.1 FtsW/RodA/SpoVE family cell cycle protein [bacterium]
MSLATRIYAELQGDRAIWAVIALLAMFSVMAVYSSTGTLAYREMGGNTESFLVKHFLIVVGGLFLTYLAHLMHYMKYSRSAPVLLLISVPLLIYTIAFGADINDARRWIEVPFVGVTFQTSDFAKLALIIYLARMIGSKQDYIKDFQSAFVPIIVPVLIICGLIAPADLSTAILLFFTSIMMMFVGRVALQYIALLLLLGIVVFAMLVLLGEFFPEVVRSDTWVNRVREYMDNPDGGYQVQQAKIAMANGEWLGLGPGNSIQRNYLPSPYSDFIYAIIVEEYGIFGGFAIIGLYVALFFRSTRLVTKSPKAFGAMLVIGLSISLVLQAFINIAVSVHLVPVTGVTLPMVSMGGTSILFTCISFGMILSVSKYIETVDGGG